MHEYKSLKREMTARYDWKIYGVVCVSLYPLRPSTFAQAAKLKRMATAKEKELSKCEFISCCKFFTFPILSRAIVQ